MNNKNPLYLHLKAGSTSEALKLFPKRNNFEGLSADQKGFWYEGYIQYLLDLNDVNYVGNPTSFGAWKENPTKGHDIIIKYPNGTKIRVECKFTLNHLYPCWVKEDWLSRDADIIVTNDVHAVPYRERILLRKQRKKLMSTTEFIMYMQKMIGGNQHSWNNAVVDSIRVYIESKLDVVLADLMLFYVQGSTEIKCEIGKVGKCVRRLSIWKYRVLKEMKSLDRQSCSKAIRNQRIPLLHWVRCCYCGCLYACGCVLYFLDVINCMEEMELCM